MKALPLSLLLSLIAGISSSGQSTDPFAAANAKREAARQRDANRSLISRGRSAEAVGSVSTNPNDPNRPPAAGVIELVMQEGKLTGDHRVQNAESEFDSPANAESALKEARSLYPELADPSSFFSLRCRGIAQYFASQNHPLMRNGRRALLIAHMAAIEIYGSAQRDGRQAQNDSEVAGDNVRQDEAYRMTMDAKPIGSSMFILPPVRRGSGSSDGTGGPAPVVGKQGPLPTSFKLQILPDGFARFEDGQSSLTKTDLMGRLRITFPGQITRGFAIPTEQDAGYVTMPDGSSRRFTKVTAADGTVRYQFQ